LLESSQVDLRGHHLRLKVTNIVSGFEFRVKPENKNSFEFWVSGFELNQRNQINEINDLNEIDQIDQKTVRSKQYAERKAQKIVSGFGFPFDGVYTE
jgi:hypothetical protein